jgi:hypothetical protein
LAYSVEEDGAITFRQEQLLANASDVDGDNLSDSNLNAVDSTVVDNGDGTFTVTSDADFNLPTMRSIFLFLKALNIAVR